jgi:hypothetical protein
MIRDLIRREPYPAVVGKGSRAMWLSGSGNLDLHTTRERGVVEFEGGDLGSGGHVEQQRGTFHCVPGLMFCKKNLSAPLSDMSAELVSNFWPLSLNRS